MIESAAQQARAPMVQVGALALFCGNALPPTVNTFGTSHDCRYLLTALVAGSVPITAPPVFGFIASVAGLFLVFGISAVLMGIGGVLTGTRRKDSRDDVDAAEKS